MDEAGMAAEQCCRISLMKRMSEPPQAPLLQLLSEETLRRSEAFTALPRRCDFLWGRILLLYTASRLGLKVHLRENPPKSPDCVTADGMPLSTSISHTSTLVGSLICPVKAALDLEVVKDRKCREIFCWVFGEELWARLPVKDRIRGFYRSWGIYECAIKTGGSCSGFSVSIDGRKAEVTHLDMPENTMLTVVTASPARIEVQETDPEKISRELFAKR